MVRCGVVWRGAINTCITKVLEMLDKDKEQYSIKCPTCNQIIWIQVNCVKRGQKVKVLGIV